MGDLQITDDHIKPLLLKDSQCIFPIRGDLHPVPLFLQSPFDLPGKGLLIIHNQDTALHSAPLLDTPSLPGTLALLGGTTDSTTGRTTGRTTRKTLPSPASLSASIRPPWASMIRDQGQT